MNYSLDPRTVSRFRRTALLDIDPGFLQNWIMERQIGVAEYDYYFTIGETVGQADSRIPDCGRKWEYTSPAVFLPSWPVSPAGRASAYTTVSGWWIGWDQWNGEIVDNRKRTAFLRILGPTVSNRCSSGTGFGSRRRQRGRGRLPGEQRVESKRRHRSERVPRAISAVYSTVSWRIQLRQDILRLPRHCMGERPDHLLSRQRQTCGRRAHGSQPISSGQRRSVSFSERRGRRPLSGAGGGGLRPPRSTRSGAGMAQEYFDAAVVTKRLLERI